MRCGHIAGVGDGLAARIGITARCWRQRRINTVNDSPGRRRIRRICLIHTAPGGDEWIEGKCIRRERAGYIPTTPWTWPAVSDAM